MQHSVNYCLPRRGCISASNMMSRFDTSLKKNIISTPCRIYLNISVHPPLHVKSNDSQSHTSCVYQNSLLHNASHFFSCIQKAISFCHSLHPLRQTLETSSNTAPSHAACLIYFPLTSYHIVSSFLHSCCPMYSSLQLGFVMGLSW